MSSELRWFTVEEKGVSQPPLRLYRWWQSMTGSQLVQRWDEEQEDWVDCPELYEGVELGCNTHYREINELEAGRIMAWLTNPLSVQENLKKGLS